MQKQIISRLAAFGRQGIASTAVRGVAFPQPQIFRLAPVAKLHSTPARLQSAQEYLVAQQARDAASAAKRNAAKREFESLPEEDRSAILDARNRRRQLHIQEIEAIETKNYVPLEVAVQKYREAALSGPNYRGAAINWFIRAPWILRLLQARSTATFQGRREVSKERVEAANFRILRFARFPEVDFDGKWDGDVAMVDSMSPKPE
jgi:hypothetical protein